MNKEKNLKDQRASLRVDTRETQQIRHCDLRTMDRKADSVLSSAAGSRSCALVLLYLILSISLSVIFSRYYFFVMLHPRDIVTNRKIDFLLVLWILVHLYIYT